MTQSPPLMWGVNVGLCLPRSTWATRLASRPSGCPAASTTYQRCVTSSLRRLNVFISAIPKSGPVGGSRERYPGPKAPSTRGFRTFEGDERRAPFHLLSRRTVHRGHAARARRAQLVLHLHRLHHHEPGAGVYSLTGLHFDPHYEPGHRRPDRPGRRRSHPAARERLDLAGPLVHHLDLHSLTDDPQRPPPHAPWERLGRDGPRLTTEEQVVRSEEHTSELQSRLHLVCRLLLEKKKKKNKALTCQQR